MVQQLPSVHMAKTVNTLKRVNHTDNLYSLQIIILSWNDYKILIQRVS